MAYYWGETEGREGQIIIGGIPGMEAAQEPTNDELLDQMYGEIEKNIRSIIGIDGKF